MNAFEFKIFAALMVVLIVVCLFVIIRSRGRNTMGGG